MSYIKFTAANGLGKTSGDVGMHFGKLCASWVKIGKYLKPSDVFWKTPDVFIMTDSERQSNKGEV